MGIPNKQIGWSQESSLYYEIIKKLNRLEKVLKGSFINPPPLGNSITFKGQFIPLTFKGQSETITFKIPI